MIADTQIVLRQSHRKSMQGCKACKSRRLKCDELRPTCYRCQKSGKSCAYADQQGRGRVAGLISWPAIIEEACKMWKEQGRLPFKSLTLTESPSWHTLSMTELKYLYHMGLIESILSLSGTRDMCPPWGDVPVLFQLANRFSYVLYALATGSATRLARLLKSQEAAQDAEKYHDLALRGISHASESLTKDNADAILGAALCCSYNTSNHNTMIIVAEYSSVVLSVMDRWSKTSIFCRPLLDGDFCEHMQPARQRLPQTATPPALCGNFGDTDISNLLIEGVNALSIIAPCYRELNYAAMIRRLRDSLRLVHERPRLELSKAEQYKILLPFTDWFSRDEASCYIAVAKRDPQVLTFLLHMYAAIIALTLALPGTDVATFTIPRIRAILEIHKTLEEINLFRCESCDKSHYSDRSMLFPLNTVRQYYRHGRRRVDI